MRDALGPPRVFTALLETSSVASCVILLVGCSIPIPHQNQVPPAERADAKSSYETWTYVVTPPRGASWALSGAVTRPDHSSLRCEPPANLRASLIAVGTIADELNFCLASGIAWEKLYWEDPSEYHYSQRWGLTVARLDLVGSGLVNGDSVWTARLVDSMRAIEREVAAGSVWKAIETTTIRSGDTRHQALHFIGERAEESGWVALTVRNGLVFAVISKDQPSADSDAYRVLRSVREWATHHAVYWGVVTDPDGRPVEAAVVSAGTSVGEVREPSPCNESCGRSGPDGRYRLYVFLGGADVVAPGRTFWLLASPGARMELKEAVDTMTLPGSFSESADSMRVDFVLRP